MSRLVSNVIPTAAIFAWVAIGLSLQAQTGRIYTSDDYSRAANQLNAGTIALVDHAIKRAADQGNGLVVALRRAPLPSFHEPSDR